MLHRAEPFRRVVHGGARVHGVLILRKIRGEGFLIRSHARVVFLGNRFVGQGNVLNGVGVHAVEERVLLQVADHGVHRVILGSEEILGLLEHLFVGAGKLALVRLYHAIVFRLRLLGKSGFFFLRELIQAQLRRIFAAARGIPQSGE